MNSSTTTEPLLLKVEDLSVEFESAGRRTLAVDKVSFELEQGRTLGLVGESGSGKSVTSLAIMGLIPSPPGRILGGQVIFQGSALEKLTEDEYRKFRGNRMSMIFQEPMTSLNPVFSVGDQISEVLMLHKSFNRTEAIRESISLLDQVGIAQAKERIKSYPHELSGGQKQRVMIAMAIACKPELLIADEPTTALDVTVQKQVLELLLRLKEEYRMGMLFITHDLGLIKNFCDDVLVMYGGKIVESATVDEVFRDPKHPYTQGLLKCRPSLSVRPKRLPTVSDFWDREGNALEPKLDMTERPVRKDSGEVLLRVENLEKSFPVRSGIWGRVSQRIVAVNRVSFILPRARTLGLVGESGSGKTTLGRSLLRLIEPTAGRVFYRETDLASLGREPLRKLRRKMQIIFQDPYSSLNPRMTILEALLEPMKIHGIGSGKGERMDRAGELLKRVGLSPDFLGRYPHEFSGGQRQRICIARALSVEPEFIVCDECVSALDVSIQAQILNLLLELQESLSLTYLFISHDLSVVKFISDEVAVMYQGELVEKNHSDELYRNPQHSYTKKLLAAIPTIN